MDDAGTGEPPEPWPTVETDRLDRPSAPPTWGERYDELRARVAIGPWRLLLAGAAVLLVGALGWWLLRPPPPAVEQTLPYASTTVAGSPTGTGPAGADSGATGGSSPGPMGGTTAPVNLVVHGAGAVRVPGVYRLPPGSRVDDLVAAAGGLAPDADPARLNLAAPLQDGQRVYVPHLGEVSVPPAVTGDGPQPATTAGGSSGTSSAGGPAAPVNLNTASIQELDTLPGVGPSTAQAILDYRQQHGRFATVDELLEVRGIGDAKLAQLKDRVAV